MYRPPAIAFLLAATALQPSLEGQMRSARPNIPVRSSVGGSRSPRRSFGTFRPPFRSFGSGYRVFIRPAFRRGFRVDIFFGNSCFTSAFFDPFFCQQFFFPNRFAFAQPIYVPYPIYSAPSYQAADSTSTTAEANDYADLRGELGRLTSEVDVLRQEQALREQTRQASPPPSPVLENTPTILVFRDGHRSEIRNYAIVGKTLWVFTEQRARKISVSDLDIDATRGVNAEHGVEVPFP